MNEWTNGHIFSYIAGYSDPILTLNNIIAELDVLLRYSSYN